MSLSVVKNEVMLIPDMEIVAVTPSKEYFAVPIAYYPAGEPMNNAAIRAKSSHSKRLSLRWPRINTIRNR